MKYSNNLLNWALRLYPPLFFNRIWLKGFSKDYTSCKVKIFKSLLNTNFNGTIFGGTIFSATDPFYALCYYQILHQRGFKVQTWLKSASIQYKKPADQNLFLEFNVSEQDIQEAINSMNSIGKFVKTYEILIKDKDGVIYAVAQNEVYGRLLKNTNLKEVAGF